MRRRMMHGKIHRATVTQADLHYEGSVTIAADLMEAADILPYEWVCIWNVTRGTRLETYAIAGPAGSGVVCVNGAAAHLNEPGDIVILCTHCDMDDHEARQHVGVCVRVDENNTIIGTEPETPGPEMPEKVA